MRVLPIIALAAGCYAPDIEPGGTCTTVCPGGLSCIDGICVVADDGDPSLVAHWRFDDPPEDGALDSSGRRHHATCRSCPVLVPGKIGGGYRFDALAKQVLVVSDDPADFRGSYTIAAWVLAEKTGDQIALLSKPHDTGSGNSWQLEVLENDHVSLSSGMPHSLESPDSITEQEWHHLAGTWDRTTQKKQLYIDGTWVISTTATVEYDDHSIFLGGDQNGGDEVLFWDGVLDDLRIYNRALSEAEIAALAR